ncbi:HepT-like ribonuclease domain-containing protein [Natronincola ferrireducens]|uniref:Uncharacterized conserved protein, contains HEPN domain n=1 Tax=Natronincola ferrireducens TaxID=393762 RepID=A0A1G8YBK3_9FIRM|nr:DUF86 domain-containing protein [Natronincola ferrireducens]SDK00076.1 Uncharacterized conserved protein, contains HEPN domain [Natronincola ferrireducens]
MKSDKIYLIHIMECIENIEEYTEEGKEKFIKSQLIQDAVIRNLEIIGEATKKISKDTRNSYSELPWREMAGLRDVLIHDYFGVDIKIVWNVVEKELPKVKRSVKVILADYI